ncbi:FAD-binding oxidoreductase [Streptomyces paludis]|uniref:FAD-binding oxidoreductase n=1 Tax=Streptomyces paludis TaxID=2282738 RepID=A0A345HT13_9ACTN|nr:FAD-binding oxidoreductase [Streptomyces paludis]AXG79837.1 FAD-binding oxidoreductase [Streptomyces paludis]
MSVDTAEHGYYDEDSVVSLTGLGRTSPTTALLLRPRSPDEAAAAVRAGGERGLIARGLGRSCGDAAQNAGGAVLDMTGLDRIRALDVTTGVVVCEAGLSLRRLLEVLLPLGWCLPVTPVTGGYGVTVGGAIGADVEGANHPAAGSFSAHVSALELLTADGERRTALPGTPLFDATAGGLGLTGVILSATLRLRRVATSLMIVDTERATDLDDLFARLAAADPRPYPAAPESDPGPEQPRGYAVAWLDPLARGAELGRAVLVRGEHAPLSALPARARRRPLLFRPGPRDGLSALVPPPGLPGRAAAGLLNGVWYRTAPRLRSGELRRLPVFGRPPGDAVPWHRLPGPGRGGFVRYRFTVGYGREETLRRIVERLARHGCPSFPAALTRFGAAGSGWLSFPAPGWSLTVELPADPGSLGPLLDALDEEVVADGGRVCLAQDARIRPERLAAMYPRLAEFRALRAELDPRSVFTSDLSRRLRL